MLRRHHKQIDIDARLIRLYITAADYREQAYDYKLRRSVRHRYEQRAERCAFDIAFKEELCKDGIDNKAEQNIDDRRIDKQERRIRHGIEAKADRRCNGFPALIGKQIVEELKNNKQFHSV